MGGRKLLLLFCHRSMNYLILFSEDTLLIYLACLMFNIRVSLRQEIYVQASSLTALVDDQQLNCRE